LKPADEIRSIFGQQLLYSVLSLVIKYSTRDQICDVDVVCVSRGAAIWVM